MGFHLGLEGVDDLLGGIEMGMAQNLYQAVVAKLFLLRKAFGELIVSYF